MPLFGFPLKIKTSAGPGIKYFSAQFPDKLHAEGFAGNLNRGYGDDGTPCVANHGMYDVNERLVIHTENDYELPAGYSPTDEVWVTWKLTYEVQGEVQGTGYLTIPCLDASQVDTVSNMIVQSQVCVLGQDGDYHPCTSAEVYKRTSYRV